MGKLILFRNVWSTDFFVFKQFLRCYRKLMGPSPFALQMLLYGAEGAGAQLLAVVPFRL